MPNLLGSEVVDDQLDELGLNDVGSGHLRQDPGDNFFYLYGEEDH